MKTPRVLVAFVDALGPAQLADKLRDSVVAHGSFRVLEADGSEYDVELYERAVRMLRQLDPAMGTADDAVPFRTTIFGVHIDEISGRQARGGA